MIPTVNTSGSPVPESEATSLIRNLKSLYCCCKSWTNYEDSGCFLPLGAVIGKKKNDVIEKNNDAICVPYLSVCLFFFFLFLSIQRRKQDIFSRRLLFPDSLNSWPRVKAWPKTSDSLTPKFIQSREVIATLSSTMNIWSYRVSPTLFFVLYKLKVIWYFIQYRVAFEL